MLLPQYILEEEVLKIKKNRGRRKLLSLKMELMPILQPFPREFELSTLRLQD